MIVTVLHSFLWKTRGKCQSQIFLKFPSVLSYCTSEKKPQRRQRNYSLSTDFLDTLRIHVKAGTGGEGLPTKGGLGGKGGDVVIVGNSKMDLKTLKKTYPDKRFKAERGDDSRFFCLFGKPGKSLEIPVPVGITAVAENGLKIGEVNKAGEKVVIARGK